jgi:hypothetical protein
VSNTRWGENRTGWNTHPWHSGTGTEKRHLDAARHSGRGGGVSPIRFKASRMAGADVRSPSRQSTSGNSFRRTGTATLARGPRFPKEAATQNRTESSLVLRRETNSFNVGSSTSSGSMLRVKSARRLAAFVLIVKVPPARMLAIVSSSCLFNTARPVDCAPEHNAQTNAAARTANRSKGNRMIFAILGLSLSSGNAPCHVNGHRPA